MFNWFNNTNSSGPAGVSNGNTTAGAAAGAGGVGGGNTGGGLNTNWMGVQVEPMTGTTGGFSGKGFAGNMGMIMGGVQALGNLWNSYQQNKLAKEQFAFQKDAWNTNINMQKQTYNTALDDRIRSRHAATGQSSADTEAYLDKHKL